MKRFKNTDLRGALDHIPTGQLDEILREELHKTPVDEKTVRLVLRELKQRERNHPLNTGKESGQAWIRYLAHGEAQGTKTRRWSGWTAKLLCAAAVAVLLLLVFPREASAAGFFQRISRWTESIFELFAPEQDNQNEYVYVFTTEHPGLQQLHTAVTELGITGPAVPMWIPDGFELVEIKSIESRTMYGLYAAFSNGKEDIVWEIKILKDGSPSKYYKTYESVLEIEKEGIIHYAMKNSESWIVVWTKENIEYFFAGSCTEDDMYKMIMSIYTLEE